MSDRREDHFIKCLICLRERTIQRCLPMDRAVSWKSWDMVDVQSQ